VCETTNKDLLLSANTQLALGYLFGSFFYGKKMNTQEIWKAVADSNGIYHISSYGRVKSLKFGKEVMLKSNSVRGYLAVTIYLETGKRTTKTIHKLVANAFIENPYNKREVNHIDGDKLNNNVSNLEWMTRKENAQHGWDTGLFEKARLSISKPVIDILTNKKYPSLKSACQETLENYRTNKSRIYFKSPRQRFFYITDGNR
jgi:hypothetical protein